MTKLKFLIPLIGILSLSSTSHVEGRQDGVQVVPVGVTPVVSAVGPKFARVLPQVQVVAPARVEKGGMVVVKAVTDQAKFPEGLLKIKYQWLVFADGRIKPDIMIWPDGTQVFFAAGIQERDFTIFLDVDCLYGTQHTPGDDSIIDSPDIESPELTSVVVSVGDSPGPGPSPNPPAPPSPNPPDPQPQPDPTFADGQFKLAAFTYQTLKGDASLSVDEKAKLGPALASSFEGIAAKIAAVSTYKDPTVILTDLKAANVSAIKNSGVDPSKTAAFNKVLGDQVYKLYATDQVVSTADDFAAAFREIGTGLKAFTPKGKVSQ